MQNQATQNQQPAINNRETEKHHVSIQTLDNGYLVTVGCKNFGFETKEAMLNNLTAYFNDPTGTTEKFYNGELFKAK